MKKYFESKKTILIRENFFFLKFMHILISYSYVDDYFQKNLTEQIFGSKLVTTENDKRRSKTEKFVQSSSRDRSFVFARFIEEMGKRILIRKKKLSVCSTD